MMKLIPEKIEFEISTTDLSVNYSERNKCNIILDMLDFENFLTRKNYRSIRISFDIVAELRCYSVNFFETFHDEYDVIKTNKDMDDYDFWRQNKYHPDSGFYQVEKSKWILDTSKKYNPMGQFELNHFLIIGNDSYVEILASNYKLSEVL